MDSIGQAEHFDPASSLPRPLSDGRRARADLLDGLLAARLWSWMAFAEIKRRYRRTLIGPFWTTLSYGIFISSMGILWSALWHMDARTFLPYLASGQIAWILISSTILEGCTVYVAAGNTIRHTNLPLSIYVYALVLRNLIVMAHHLLFFVLVGLVFSIPFSWATLLLVPGALLVSIVIAWMATMVGIICTRYRDIAQIIGSVLQIIMFMTPIFWTPNQIAGNPLQLYFINFNLFNHLVELIRAPMLGELPSALSCWVAACAAIGGWALTVLLYMRYRRYLVLWT